MATFNFWSLWPVNSRFTSDSSSKKSFLEETTSKEFGATIPTYTPHTPSSLCIRKSAVSEPGFDSGLPSLSVGDALALNAGMSTRYWKLDSKRRCAQGTSAIIRSYKALRFAHRQVPGEEAQIDVYAKSCIVKVFKYPEDPDSTTTPEQISKAAMNEISIMTILGSSEPSNQQGKQKSRIVKLYDSFVNSDLQISLLIMEDMHSDAFKYLHDPSLPVDFIGYFFNEVLTGLDFIHASGLVHRDIKPENIFIKTVKERASDNVYSYSRDRHIIKIGDFGHAAGRNTETYCPFGSLGFLAPEAVAALLTYSKEYEYGIKYTGKPLQCEEMIDISRDIKLDAFSLGVTILRFFTFKNPFYPQDYYQRSKNTYRFPAYTLSGPLNSLEEQIVAYDLLEEFLDENDQPTALLISNEVKKKRANEEGFQLILVAINQLLQFQTKNRTTCSKLLKSPVFAGGRWSEEYPRPSQSLVGMLKSAKKIRCSKY